METTTEYRRSNSLQEDGANENVANGNENVANGNENVANCKENVANGNGNAANERSISLGEDYEIISDDDEDYIKKDSINKIKDDLNALVKDKLKFTKEKEELVETLRISEKNVLELQQQVDWFVELNISFINKKDVLPAVPTGFTEEAQKRLFSIHTEMERMLKGDSITTSFTNVEIETDEKLDEQNQPSMIDVKGKPELQSQVTQTEERAKTELNSKHTQTDVSFTELEKLFGENNALMHVTADQKKAIEEKDQMVLELENRLKFVTVEKENALLRISKLAGVILTENNPGISDLRADYRPLKIAEMFYELYDNEWTNALSTLMSEMKKSEDDGVQTLLEILQEISVQCQFGVVQQQKNVYNALILKNESKNTEMTERERRKVKEFQKKMASSFFQQLEQSILENETFQTGPFWKEAQLCQPYIRKCIQLCWIMNVHDPAMELVFEFYSGQKIDEKLIKPYKKRGSKINYLVWPVLLLYHGGPVAQKGIAQPF